MKQTSAVVTKSIDPEFNAFKIKRSLSAFPEKLHVARMLPGLLRAEGLKGEQ
jgi:hypothetical protein